MTQFVYTRSEIPFDQGGAKEGIFSKLELEPPGHIPNVSINEFSDISIFTGDTIFTEPICAKEIRLKSFLSTNIQLQDGSANYLSFKAPDVLSANVDWILPATDGTIGQYIKTDGSGILDWATDAGGDITSAGNLVPITLTQADGVKSISSTTITVSNDNELSNVKNINLSDPSPSMMAPENNTWYGYLSMLNLTLGNKNSAFGETALEDLTTGNRNTAFGNQSLRTVIGTHDNTGFGNETLQLTLGSENTGVGGYSLTVNNSGDRNTAVGFESLRGNFSGSDNVAIGWKSMGSSSTGIENTAIGTSCLDENSASDRQTGIGFQCLKVSDGDDNTAIGHKALVGIQTAINNIAIGVNAGSSYTNAESNNLLIGNVGVLGESNKLKIGTSGTHTTCEISGIHSITPPLATQNVVIDSNGELGSSTQLSASFIATEDDNFAVNIDCDAAGFADIKALDVIYKAGALNAGDFNIASLVLLDESITTGGRLFGNAVLSTDLGLAETHALGVGSTVHPIYHQSGGYANADSILVNAVDEKTDLSSGGAGNVSVFVADNDTMTVGSSAKYSQMQIQVDTPSSGGGVSPTFEYSTGVGTWAFFSPTDGTNGFRNTGIISWDINDIAGWLVGLDSEFLIKVTRTRNMLTTTPILDLVQITAVTLYVWDKNGDVNVNSVNVKECNLMETGGGTDIITLQAPAAIGGYTLTLPVDDGDADEVLTTDGSGILSWTSGGLPSGYLSGFEQVNATTTTITFGTTSETSTCRDVDNTFDITWSGLITLTITDTDVAGGYSDGGGNPVGANQPLQIYAIADSTGVNTPNVLCSAVGQDITGLSLFTGGSYDKLRLIGWARTLDGAATLIPHMVGGKGSGRSFHYTANRDEMAVLIAGSSTVWIDMASGGNGTDSYTAPAAHQCVCRMAFGTSAAANDEAAFRINGSSIAIGQALYTHSHGSSLGATELSDTQIFIALGSDRITEYIVSAAANDLYVYVIAFMYNL